MNIEPVAGESLRFYVQSRSDPGIRHMVDLSLNQGNGFCSCQGFSFVCEKNIKAGKTLFSRGSPVVNPRGKISFPEATICPHIEAVHRLLLEKLLRQAAARAAGKSSARSSVSART